MRLLKGLNNYHFQYYRLGSIESSHFFNLSVETVVISVETVVICVETVVFCGLIYLSFVFRGFLASIFVKKYERREHGLGRKQEELLISPDLVTKPGAGREVYTECTVQDGASWGIQLAR